MGTQHQHIRVCHQHDHMARVGQGELRLTAGLGLEAGGNGASEVCSGALCPEAGRMGLLELTQEPYAKAERGGWALRGLGVGGSSWPSLQSRAGTLRLHTGPLACPAPWPISEERSGWVTKFLDGVNRAWDTHSTQSAWPRREGGQSPAAPSPRARPDPHNTRTHTGTQTSQSGPQPGVGAEGPTTKSRSG